MVTEIPDIQRCVSLVPGPENPGHVDNNLSASQSAELIADHFAAISQNYDPINVEHFPPNPKMSDVPCLEEYEIFRKISKSKKPTPQFLVTCQRR